MRKGAQRGGLCAQPVFIRASGLHRWRRASPSPTYVVIARHFGNLAGILAGGGLGGVAAFAWFGFAFLVGRTKENDEMGVSQTPLATKIEQLLTEARVIIPGAQALFGFQFVAMLTNGFDHLPQASKNMHAVALGLIAINVVLLMTPAAVHRLSFGGDRLSPISADRLRPRHRRADFHGGRNSRRKLRRTSKGNECRGVECLRRGFDVRCFCRVLVRVPARPAHRDETLERPPPQDGRAKISSVR